MNQGVCLSFFCRLLIALTGFAALPAKAVTMSPEQLYQYLAPSVWLVRTYDADGLVLGVGSAVVTGPETLLTNCHVLEKAKRFVVRNDNVQHDARLQHIDVQRDLCQITARNLRAPSVALADSDQLNVGQKVFTLGNPRGLELTLSDALISALRLDENTRSLQLIQTSAPFSSGSSGGGLFDTQARLIGITTLITVARDAQNLNFAIPINWQRDLASRSNAALQSARQSAATPVVPAPVVASPPVASAPGAAALDDVTAIPVNPGCKDEYRKYIVAANPKAFAFNGAGRCFWQQSRKASRPEIVASPDPAVRAMELCVHFFKTPCTLYAVDSAVVYGR